MQHKPQPAEVLQFAQSWVSHNVRQVPGLVDLSREVDSLASRMTADARAAGISGSLLARSVGDLDDYLTLAYQACAA